MYKEWLIPDAFLPAAGPKEPYGHEAICILNTREEDARITLDLYFETREPERGVTLVVAAERTKHVRMDRPEDLGGVHVPREVPYAVRVRSTVPVAVQYSRLDVTQPNLSLMTTLALPVGGS